MALKIRLRQQGKNNRPFYRIVLADVRSPRDGKYIEMLGWYNPFEKEEDKIMSIYADRIQHWLANGAEISEKVEILIEKMAPAVIKTYREKKLAQRLKATAKRRQLRKKEVHSA